MFKGKQFFRIQNERTGELVGTKVLKAGTFWLRLRGLLGKSRLDEGEGLWLVPCRQVHMLGMRFSLSIWFLDRDGVVLAILDELKPLHISPYLQNAASVIEFPVNWARTSGTREGDKLVWI